MRSPQPDLSKRNADPACYVESIRELACTPNDDEMGLAGGVALGTIGGTKSLPQLTNLANPGRVVGERIAAAAGIAVFDLRRASAFTSKILSRDVPPARISQLLAQFTQRKAGPDSLATALDRTPATRDNARLALRWLHSTGLQPANLVAAFNKAAGFDVEPLRATSEFVAKLGAEVRSRGDATRGREIFCRADLACVNCHSVGGEGGNIGPDLNAIGSGQPLDFIIGAVLEPNREVKESFEAVEVTTKDGETYTGFRANAGDGEFALRDTVRNEVIRIRQDRISQQRNIGSVMPDGLFNQFTREELIDLFRYLAELGKGKP